MQFADQHYEAIKPTVWSKSEIGCSIFDDKVKCMGEIVVSQGKITITLDYVPGMVSSTATRDFLIDAINCGLKTCFDENPEAFESR